MKVLIAFFTMAVLSHSVKDVGAAPGLRKRWQKDKQERLEKEVPEIPHESISTNRVPLDYPDLDTAFNNGESREFWEARILFATSIPDNTPAPSPANSPAPTASPTDIPATTIPTDGPGTPAPSETPTTSISSVPTSGPTAVPTPLPFSSAPTPGSSFVPTSGPTALPTPLPFSGVPTPGSSFVPTAGPTTVPTLIPISVSPSDAPPTQIPASFVPTAGPTAVPTLIPFSVSPSDRGTGTPSSLSPSGPLPNSTDAPTLSPTTTSSMVPSDMPSLAPTNAPETDAPTARPSNFSAILTLQAETGVCGGGDTSGIGCGELNGESEGNESLGNPNDLINCYDVTDFNGNAPFFLNQVRFWIGDTIPLPSDLSIRVWNATSESAPIDILFDQALSTFSIGENSVALETPLEIFTEDFCVGLSSKAVMSGLRLQTESGEGDDSYVLAPLCDATEFRTLENLGLDLNFCIEAFVSGVFL